MILWKLPELLKREGITAYRLNKELAGHAATNTAYRWAREMPRTLDVDVLRWMLDALERITGKQFGITDALEYESTNKQAPEDVVHLAQIETPTKPPLPMPRISKRVSQVIINEITNICGYVPLDTLIKAAQQEPLLVIHMTNGIKKFNEVLQTLKELDPEAFRLIEEQMEEDRQWAEKEKGDA